MVISRHVPGKYRTLRYVVEFILAMIFFGVPWLNFNNAPLMRLDIPSRKFFLLGGIYIPQEGIYLHLFLGVMGLSLFFFTTLIGRVWCGWACPQTVFTDFFDLMGRLILGKKYGKKDAPLFKKIILQITWVAFSLLSGFHVLAYFVDPRIMLAEFSTMSVAETSVYHYFFLAFSGLLYVDMTFVREQFCKYACPYARFQTVMMDAHSFNVTYDYKRGEPRRNKQVKIGDCTACNMCLVVCPTGVDIREGLNVGCIACAKCVDACTIQMAKENKKSLIDYTSLAKIETGQSIKWIRPRTIVYGILLSIISVVSLYLLYSRIPLYARVLPDRVILPMITETHQVRSFFNIDLINMDYKDVDLVVDIDKGKFPGETKLDLGSGSHKIQLKGDSEKSLKFYLESSNFPKSQKTGQKYEVFLQIKDQEGKKVLRRLSLPLLLPDDPELN